METETVNFQTYLAAFRKYADGCNDMDELMKLADSLRDVLIEIMPFLINTQKGIRKKDILKRRFMEIVADRHGV